MAEVWFISIDTRSLEGLEPRHEGSFIECVEFLELRPDNWECEPEALPDFKTGNPLIDDSGYIYVLMRATGEEIEEFGDNRWKPGWYKSPLTIVGFEKNLRKKPG
ncbi:MAG: hypothetical protein RIG61_14100 [Deltaproteobacteria bacterium]